MSGFKLKWFLCYQAINPQRIRNDALSSPTATPLGKSFALPANAAGALCLGRLTLAQWKSASWQNFGLMNHHRADNGNRLRPGIGKAGAKSARWPIASWSIRSGLAAH